MASARWVRRLLPILVYPWGISRLVAWPFRSARQHSRHPILTSALFVIQILAQVFVVAPIAILATVEIVIIANRHVVGDQADYELLSDHTAGLAGVQLELPGAPAPDVVVPSENSRDFDQKMVEAYAPVVVHHVANEPLWDVPVGIAFDGTVDPRDNPTNLEAASSLVAVVHGELTAITADSYYLTYSLYHGADYDHPVREWVSRWTYHDSDNEGLHIRVDRQSGAVVQAETWFHNRFLLCSTISRSKGTEPVTGTLQLEGPRRLIVFAQSQGHGVRCAQKTDEPAMSDLKVLRPRLGRARVNPLPDRRGQPDITYELESFDLWYEHARSFRHADGLFADSIVVRAPSDSTKAWVVGRFIAGLDREDVGAWSRPKPMWAWDDGWDDIPVTFWHFLPSVSFSSHSGEAVSHQYLANRPIRHLFDTDAETFMATADLATEYRAGDKWEGLEERGEPSRGYYLGALYFAITRYINYVFLKLG